MTIKKLLILSCLLSTALPVHAENIADENIADAAIRLLRAATKSQQLANANAATNPELAHEYQLQANAFALAACQEFERTDVGTNGQIITLCAKARATIDGMSDTDRGEVEERALRAGMSAP
jgi:hypothetical protein